MKSQPQFGRRILVVDDDQDIHRLLRVALAPGHVQIESAYDGAEGLDKFTAASWDLVITDVIMPGMDGLELLQRIEQTGRGTPVVVMTVDTTDEKVIAAIRSNAFSWMRKPFTIDAVRDMVEQVLAGTRFEDGIKVLSASPRWLELRIRCDLETAARALLFLEQLESGLDKRERENIALAFREILFNAVEHGGGNNPYVHVTVTYTRAERAILFRVRDPGPGFSFDRLKHAAVSNPADSPAEHVGHRLESGIRPGGFGILMTRALIDELIYNEKGNEVLLIKYVNRPSQATAEASPGLHPNHR